MKKRKSLKILILCMMIGLLIGINVKAEEKGNIIIKLERSEEDILKDPIVWQYTKVGEMKNGNYVLNKFGEDVVLEKDCTAEKMNALAKEMQKKIEKPDGRSSTNKDGRTEIQGLSEGIYLLTNEHKNSNQTIEPFFVSVPTWNEVIKEMEYDILVIPKHSEESHNKPVAPQTNYNSNIVRKIISAMACVLGIIILIYVLKRKDQNEKHL